MFARVLAVLLIASSAAWADDVDPRYCAEPHTRSPDTVRNFRKLHLCPTTQKVSGACPGWVVDHVIPLACGGCDAIFNMQWQPVAMAKNKDAFERKIYCK